MPEFTTSKITLICGLAPADLGPAALPTTCAFTVFRPRMGNALSGVSSSQEQLINVYARLGLDMDIQMEPHEVIRAVMETRATLSLVNGFQLRRSLVMGQPRLELIGATGAILAELKTMGCFTEVIQWKTRRVSSIRGT